MRRLAGIVVLVLAATGASAAASVRVCAYRDLRGAAPHVARVRTNLTPADVPGGDVCAVVDEAVAAVQRRGYRLAARSSLTTGDRLWLVRRRLVYPPGWPQPSGPAQDPRVQVTLRMASRGARPARRSPPTRHWIRLDELT